ncbi:hypothetical protein FRC07_006812, partial [Ceratobasidium sp. 392]
MLTPVPALISQLTSDNGEIFQYWKSVYSRLTHVIQEYIDACTRLQAALVMPTRSHHLQIETRADLYLELLSLHLHEQKLQEARLRLSEAHNSSYSFVPINSLPPEILIKIFSLATHEWINEDHRFVGLDEGSGRGDIAGVCCLWRRLMLHSGVFWSELDLVLVGPTSEAHYERAALWAGRSQNVFLDVMIQEEEIEPSARVENITPSADVPPWDDSIISRAVTFLTPLMPRVRALRIEALNRPAQKLVRALLACWVQYGTIGTAKVLEIRLDVDLSELEIAEISPQGPFIQDGNLRHYDLTTFLSSLREVCLVNVAISWRRPIYSGLTEIYIVIIPGSDWCPSQRDLVDFLAANTGLRSLVLFGICIRPQRGFIPGSPVALNHLEMLSLQTRHPKDLRLVLPLISSTSDEVRMTLTLDD